MTLYLFKTEMETTYSPIIKVLNENEKQNYTIDLKGPDLPPPVWIPTSSSNSRYQRQPRIVFKERQHYDWKLEWKSGKRSKQNIDYC